MMHTQSREGGVIHVTNKLDDFDFIIKTSEPPQTYYPLRSPCPLPALDMLIGQAQHSEYSLQSGMSCGAHVPFAGVESGECEPPYSSKTNWLDL